MNDVVKGVASAQPGRFATATDPGRVTDTAAFERSPGGKGLPPANERVARDAGRESLERATRQINAYLARVDRDLRFQVDDATGIVVVKVLDGRTQEVVRQIPPETALNLARRLSRYGRLDTMGLTFRA